MEEKRSKTTILPLGKVNTIMQSSSDHEHATKESIVLVAKATELFIKKITEECYTEKNGNRLEYDHIREVVHGCPKYKFLRDIVPKKITVLEYKQIMAKKEAEERKRNEPGTSSSDDETTGTSGDDETSGTSGEETVPAAKTVPAEETVPAAN